MYPFKFITLYNTQNIECIVQHWTGAWWDEFSGCCTPIFLNVSNLIVYGSPRALITPAVGWVTVIMEEKCSSPSAARDLFFATSSDVSLSKPKSYAVGVFQAGRKWTTRVFALFATINISTPDLYGFQLWFNLFSSRETRITSYAYNSISFWIPSILTPQPRILKAVAILFRNVAHKFGDNVSPCFTPSWNQTSQGKCC